MIVTKAPSKEAVGFILSSLVFLQGLQGPKVRARSPGFIVCGRGPGQGPSQPHISSWIILLLKDRASHCLKPNVSVFTPYRDRRAPEDPQGHP